MPVRIVTKNRMKAVHMARTAPGAPIRPGHSVVSLDSIISPVLGPTAGVGRYACTKNNGDLDNIIATAAAAAATFHGSNLFHLDSVPLEPIDRAT